MEITKEQEITESKVENISNKEKIKNQEENVHSIKNSKNKNKNRNSSIELLKIFAMFLIVLSHAVPFWWIADTANSINLDKVIENNQQFILLIFRYLGQVGNLIFIISSAYFLLDSKKVKIQKAMYMFVDVFAISMINVVIFVALKVNVKTDCLIEQFMPITLKNNWFISTYILYYLIHPWLNKIIDELSKRKLLLIDLGIAIFYIVNLVAELFVPISNDILGVILIYFIVAYFKKYLKSYSNSKMLNFFTLLVSSFMLILSIVTINMLGTKEEYFAEKMLVMANIYNPLILLISISIFNIVNTTSFYIKGINNISSLTMLIYLIHDNMLIREYGKSAYWTYMKNIFTYKEVAKISFITAIWVFLASIIIAGIYKSTIEKIVKLVCDKAYKVLSDVKS